MISNSLSEPNVRRRATIRARTGKAIALWLGTAMLGLKCLAAQSTGEIPTVLTDKIYRGSGVIDLLKNVSAANLQQYIGNNGGLLLGVDLNEDNSGNESSASLGIAIKELELVITTTAGTFSFNDFFTSTTAMLREAGSASAAEFYTLFGKGGSSTITGGTTGFDLGAFDDVLGLQNVAFQGTLLSAKLNVTFLATANTRQGNESFFDFSGGFEDFALLGQQDAALLEDANFGVAAAPAGVAYVATAPVVTVPVAPSPVTPSPVTPDAGTTVPGAPLPHLWLLAAFVLVLIYGGRRDAKA